jgi:hypothetical protein
VTERLTIQMTAVMHGDSDVITESATLEAETREDLIPKVIAWMDECTEGFREISS